MGTAFAGFLGALIGAGASLIGLLIQPHYQTKREMVKMAADLGPTPYNAYFSAHVPAVFFMSTPL